MHVVYAIPSSIHMYTVWYMLYNSYSVCRGSTCEKCVCVHYIHTCIYIHSSHALSTHTIRVYAYYMYTIDYIVIYII